jgi:hypothetical protein
MPSSYTIQSRLTCVCPTVLAKHRTLSQCTNEAIMSERLLSTDTQTHDRPFPLRMARYAIQQGSEPTSALATQLIILRAMGRTMLTMEDLKRDWTDSHYVHMPIGSFNLAGALGLDGVLRKYGIATEVYTRFSHTATLSPLAWLLERVENQRGVVVAVETDELPTLAALYGDADAWPDAACALLIIGVQRDPLGTIQTYLVIDPLLGEHIRTHGPIALPAAEFEAAWFCRGCAAVATLDAACRPKPVAVTTVA